MGYPADYHMHTPLCRHATGEPREYVERALQLDLPEIGFSDHSPMRRDDFDDWRMRLSELEEYVALVRQVQQDYPQLPIRLALEIDFIPGHEDWICELAARHPWDYLIGSVHYVTNSWDVDNPGKKSEWSRRDPDEVWVAYLERLVQAASTGLFDFLGHADLPKKFRHFPQPDCTRLFRECLRVVRDKGGAIELNTAGLRKDCGEIYPSPAFLELAHEFQVPITFGSDAHAPAEVGMHFTEAQELARKVGYTHYCRFRQRERQWVAI